MDNLEDYIKGNKQLFDDLEPSNKLWEKIDDELADFRNVKSLSYKAPKSPKMVSIRVVWQMAAVFTLLVVALLSYQSGVFSVQKNTTDDVANFEIAAENMLVELEETEQFYFSLIGQKQEQTQEYDLKPKGLKSESKQALKTLDSTYNKMKIALLKNPNNDKIVNAMVENLQFRIEVLNQELEVLELINKKQKDDEKINI